MFIKLKQVLRKLIKLKQVIDRKMGKSLVNWEIMINFAADLIKKGIDMTTMTINIQDNSIMPHLLEMLGKVKGVSIVSTINHQYSIDDSLSKEEGERMVCETLMPAYLDVLNAEKYGKDFPDITELLREIEE